MIYPVENIIKGAIIGDAAGYTLNGLKKSHIKAVFRDISQYTDTSPALKHGMEKWRKPGLYSSITQFMILSGACTENRFFNAEKFIEAVKNTPEQPGRDYSFFRDPGIAEKNFISSAKKQTAPASRFTQPCARIIPLTLPLMLMHINSENLIIPVFRFVSLFTADISTALSSAILVCLLGQINPDNPATILELAIEIASSVASYLGANQHILFEMGYNPDYVITDAQNISAVIQKISAAGNISGSEQAICAEVNKTLKTPVTRASVNLPFTILPFALSIAAYTSYPSDVFLAAASEGGAASALASTAGAITCALHKDCIPALLEEKLTNRKKIFALVSDIAAGINSQQIINNLSLQEPPLTKKENEEYQSKNRKTLKNRPPGGEKKSKKAEDKLSKHIVESWTKIDKAKWKKDKSRNNDDFEL